MHPTSFGLPASSLESDPAAFLSANYSDILPPHVLNAADLAHIRDLAALKAKNKALWESQGWVVRPDGYPITNRTEGECKSYSVECRYTYKDTFLAWDFLGDLDELETGRGKVKLVDRWDMREKSIEKILGVGKDDIVSLLPFDLILLLTFVYFRSRSKTRRRTTSSSPTPSTRPSSSDRTNLPRTGNVSSRPLP